MPPQTLQNDVVLANKADGSTIRFDLTDESSIEQLSSLLNKGSITALSILHQNSHYSLPPPKRFHRNVFGFEVLYNGKHDEPVGEKIFVQADDVRASITLYYGSSMVRFDLVRTGRMQYNPAGRRQRQ